MLGLLYIRYNTSFFDYIYINCTNVAVKLKSIFIICIERERRERVGERKKER